MPLVTSKELMEEAERGNYAVGAFNAINMETAQAIFWAAEEVRSPLILQITQTTLGRFPGDIEKGYTPPEELFAVVKTLIKKSSVPVALHLDHGRTFEMCMYCIRSGFSSVMIDGSLQPDGKTPRSVEENLAVTKEVVKAAHAVKVSVEAEIGLLGQIGQEITAEELEETLLNKTQTQSYLEKIKETERRGAQPPPWPPLTRPDQAANFVKETGVDLLAVAIGTKHGVYAGKPLIAHGLIELIREVVAKEVGKPIPLVMHGGTGVPEEDVKRGIQEGIRKINIDTQMRISFLNTADEFMKEQKEEWEKADREGKARKYDIRKLLKPCRRAVQETVIYYMNLFGCAGKA